tara:strand:- start:104 stop:331 length:228 start_codon:yes stop_codon:yes gene_type:complete
MSGGKQNREEDPGQFHPQTTDSVPRAMCGPKIVKIAPSKKPASIDSATLLESGDFRIMQQGNLDIIESFEQTFPA